MKKKSEFTILERAMQTVDGFDKVCQKMKQQTISGGRSQSTLDNYIRRIALVCHIGQNKRAIDLPSLRKEAKLPISVKANIKMTVLFLCRSTWPRD